MSLSELSALSPVLIVEDDRMIAEGLSLVLDDFGIEVSGVAPTAAKALQLVAGTRPSVALVDVGLRGDRDGIELACELRAQGIPSILLTGGWGGDFDARAREAQPLAVLIKPYTPPQLMAALAKALVA